MALTKKQQALIKAVRSGNLQRVKSLLVQDYDPNVAIKTTNAPLHEAVKCNHLPIVKALIEAGAEVNKQLLYGLTPLDLAYNENFDGDGRAVAIIKYLKSQGALTSRELTSTPAKRRKTPTSKPHIKPKTRRATIAGDFAGGSMPAPQEMVPPPVKFTEEKLKDVFNPQSWVGKTAEMEKHWESVPKKLRAKFDFEAALAEAQRQTMRNNYPPSRLRKKL